MLRPVQWSLVGLVGFPSVARLVGHLRRHHLLSRSDLGKGHFETCRL